MSQRTFIEVMHVGYEGNPSTPVFRAGFIKETGAPAISVRHTDGVTRLAELPWKDVHLEAVKDTVFVEADGVGHPGYALPTFEVCEDPATPDPESSE